MTEHEHQVQFVAWFRKTFSDVLIFAIPNGGQRNIAVAAKLKAEGVTAGIPDLFIPAWSLWIEMKTPTGRLSEPQKAIKAYLEQLDGHSYLIGQGFQDIREKITQLRNMK